VLDIVGIHAFVSSQRDAAIPPRNVVFFVITVCKKLRNLFYGMCKPNVIFNLTGYPV